MPLQFNAAFKCQCESCLLLLLLLLLLDLAPLLLFGQIVCIGNKKSFSCSKSTCPASSFDWKRRSYVRDNRGGDKSSQAAAGQVGGGARDAAIEFKWKIHLIALINGGIKPPPQSSLSCWQQNCFCLKISFGRETWALCKGNHWISIENRSVGGFFGYSECECMLLDGICTWFWKIMPQNMHSHCFFATTEALNICKYS